jgi:2-oxoisovalerate dehydrogenase E1 component alpha subunit
MVEWRARDPVVRFRNWLLREGWWDDAREQELRTRTRREVIAALEGATDAPKPSVASMFHDVYAELPWHLQQQKSDTLEAARRHPHLVPAGAPLE